MKKWYMCKYDISVTIAVTVLAFFLDHRLNDIVLFKIILEKIDELHPYMCLLIGWGYFNALTFILVETFFIHLEHFWQWSIVALFTTTGARFVSQGRYPAEMFGLYEFVWETIINGLYYFPVVMLVVALIYYIRSKLKGDILHGR
ncbi:MAG: hypothetical protein H6Q72_1913 [Firmicutes bacterium]|nr:hypothetical protein [Bacillota bacterium]